MLSTPHGTLGTKIFKKENWIWEDLSTPHGTLGTIKVMDCDEMEYIKLSTPHGTLGTKQKPKSYTTNTAFNSTRYIRNSSPKGL